MATTPQTNTDLRTIAEVLLNQDDIVICGHVSPDGDCLGSQLVLWHALKALGKRATCLLVKGDPVADSLAFMPGMDEMVLAADYDGKAACFVGVDVPTRARIGEDACKILDACDVSITIDHHAVDTTMCDYVYVDPDMASASMLVWEVVKLMMDEPPIQSAVCAYTGLVTDTGGFRFQNADARSLLVASELVEYGVDPAKVATNVFQNRTLASIKLESLVVDRMMLIAGGKAVLSWVTRSEMDAVGANKADTEPLIDALRSIKDVKVACMLREHESHVRGSLRSKDGTDVSALARKHDGGGHKAAAGFTLYCGMREGVDMIASEIEALVTQGD